VVVRIGHGDVITFFDHDTVIASIKVGGWPRRSGRAGR
jgi:hypothetical protein